MSFRTAGSKHRDFSTVGCYGGGVRFRREVRKQEVREEGAGGQESLGG